MDRLRYRIGMRFAPPWIYSRLLYEKKRARRYGESKDGKGWMDTYTNAVGKERPRPTRNMCRDLLSSPADIKWLIAKIGMILPDQN